MLVSSLVVFLPGVSSRIWCSLSRYCNHDDGLPGLYSSHDGGRTEHHRSPGKVTTTFFLSGKTRDGQRLLILCIHSEWILFSTDPVILVLVELTARSSSGLKPAWNLLCNFNMHISSIFLRFLAKSDNFPLSVFSNVEILLKNSVTIQELPVFPFFWILHFNVPTSFESSFVDLIFQYLCQDSNLWRCFFFFFGASTALLCCTYKQF